MKNKEFIIPKNCNPNFEIVQGIGMKELLFFFPSIVLILIIGYFVPISITTKIVLYGILLFIPFVLVRIRPLQDRENIPIYKMILWRFEFINRKKQFLFGKKVEDLIRKGKKNQSIETSSQDRIPIQKLESGLVITNDNRIIQILKVNAVNTELMSENELENLLEKYEVFLKSITFTFQQEIISMPIDLEKYIRTQEEQYARTEDAHRKSLLRSYIEYTKSMSNTKKIMRRQRYVILDQVIKSTTPNDFESALQELDDKTEHVISGLSDLDLTCEPVNNIEATKLFQVFFNFEASLYQQINPDGIQKVTTRNPIIPFHERGNRMIYPKVVEER